MNAVWLPIDEVNIDNIRLIIKNSFFASPSFLNLWKTVGGRPLYLIVENNSSIVAVLPGVEFGWGLFKRFQALPDGLYAKLFFNEAETFDKEKVLMLVKKYLENSSYSKTFLFDFYNTFDEPDQFDIIECSTNIVDISTADFQPPDKKLQSEIRKAEREEVKIVSFDFHLHFDKFIDLMEKTERRHNRTPRYLNDFYTKLSDISKKDSRVLWYWCEHEGHPVCSHINFIEDDMVLNWQVFYDKEYSFLKANQMMTFKMIKEVKKKGVKYLNLGSSPADAGGLTVYKDKWGGQTYKYNGYCKKSLIGKLF